MNHRHEKYLKILTTMAKDISHDFQSKHVACIVYRNDIIAFGKNRKKTHPLQQRFNNNPKSIYIHAEIDAIVNSMKILTLEQMKASRLYIARVKKLNGKFVRGSSKPCLDSCQPTIAAFDIGGVYWTEDEE